MEIAPSRDAWLELPDDVRQQLKIPYPRKPAEPEHATAAVAWARHRRRAYDMAIRAAWGLVVLLAVWAVLCVWVRAARGGLHQHTVVTIALVVGAVAVLVWAGCALAVSSLTRVEAAHLATALTSGNNDIPVSSPTTVTWRYSRVVRAADALGIGVLAVAYLWAVWWFGTSSWRASNVIPLVNAALLIGITARWAYVWPWPVASSYPILATVDDHDLQVHPLNLTIPWHRVTRVRFSAGLRGPAVYWHVDDPVAVVAAAPVSPAQQRRLLRWITGNGGAIRLSAFQMREAPETVYLASERFRTGRSAAYRASATQS